MIHVLQLPQRGDFSVACVLLRKNLWDMRLKISKKKSTATNPENMKLCKFMQMEWGVTLLTCSTAFFLVMLTTTMYNSSGWKKNYCKMH